MQRCGVCHVPGIAGAPRVGDREEWARRVRPGLNAVYRNALGGMPFSAMAAKGGHRDLREDEVKAIVDYMIDAAKLSPETLAAAARYDAPGITNRDFVRLDANLDGFLSREEVAGDAALVRAYARFDSDRDGRLSASEYESADATLEQERMAVRADDRALVAAVREAIAGVKGMDSRRIKVEAANGIVALIGFVEDAATALRAYDAIKRIPGIQKIDNRLVSGHQLSFD
jgi:osmotically-inducible protein OsmY